MIAEGGLAGCSLRHLRVFLAVVDLHSATRAAEICHVSQPAVTQTLAKIEQAAGAALLSRTGKALFATAAGEVLARRLRRVFAYLDPAFDGISPRLRTTTSMAQLNAFVAVVDARNFTLAAGRLGLKQPTIHRAVALLEHDAGTILFERTSYGIVPTRTATALARAAQLAFAELRQTDSDLAEFNKRDVGRIVIGAMPLSRSYLLPRAICRFRELRPNLLLQVLEGPYADLLHGLRSGHIDFLIGALRDPPPVGDIEQRHLFEDTIVLVCGEHHPLRRETVVTADMLAAYPWIVSPKQTPIRLTFDALFAHLAEGPPKSIVESSSLILMRELLANSNHLGCISSLQAKAEIRRQLMYALPVALDHTSRPIGLTLRRNWMATPAQQQFIDLVSSLADDVRNNL